MRRIPRSRETAGTGASLGRRRRPDLPAAVPTYQPAASDGASAGPTPPRPLPATTEDDPSEEAVRRMVEAAYT